MRKPEVENLVALFLSAVSPNTLLVFGRKIRLLEKISPNSFNCVLGGDIEPEKRD
jgi:hypothetical protein